MSRLKRISLSILRQPIKSGFVATVCIMIALFFTITLALYSLSLNIKSNLIRNMPPAGYISMNSDKRYQYSLAYPDQPSMFLKKSSVETIMKRPEILSADYNVNTDLLFNNIRLNEESSQSSQSYLNFIGYNNPKMLGIIDSKIKLTQGRLLSQEELNDGLSSILIHERFAALNHLQVGDTMTVVNHKLDAIDGIWQITETKEKDLNIVGLYQTTSTTKKDDEFDLRIIFGSGQFIYDYSFDINNAIPGQFEWEHLDITLFDNGSIYLEFKTYEDSISFRDQFYKDYPNYLKFNLSSDSVKEVLTPVENILEISSLSLLVTSIFGFLMIISTVVYYTYSRKYEIGLYRLLGERVATTFRIILLEIYTIVIVGLVIGFASGTLISKSINTSIVSSYLKETEAVSSWVSDTESIQYNKTPNVINQIILNTNTNQLVIYYFATIMIVLSLSTMTIYVIFLKMNPVTLMI